METLRAKAEVCVAAWSPVTPPLSHFQKYATKAEEYTPQKDAAQAPARIASAIEFPRQFSLDDGFISLPQLQRPKELTGDHHHTNSNNEPPGNHRLRKLNVMHGLMVIM